MIILYMDVRLNKRIDGCSLEIFFLFNINELKTKISNLFYPNSSISDMMLRLKKIFLFAIGLVSFQFVMIFSVIWAQDEDKNFDDYVTYYYKFLTVFLAKAARAAILNIHNIPYFKDAILIKNLSYNNRLYVVDS